MTTEVFGARVKQARVLRRMTSKEVVASLGWPATRMTRLEKSDPAAMDAADLEALAALLRFPARFFTTPPRSRVGASDLLFRAPKSTTGKEKEYLAEFAACAGDFLEELDGMHKLPAVKLPMVPPKTDVASAAAAVRDTFEARWDEPIAYLTSDMERAGVAVVSRGRRNKSGGMLDWRRYPGQNASASGEDDVVQLLERHHGYSARVGEHRDRPLAVYRATDSWERTRFTLAHELGHLVLHHGGAITEDKEAEAHRFAAELLIPSEALAREVPPLPTLFNLVPVKLKWGMSIGALVNHLFQSRLIDQSRYDSLRSQLYTRVNPETGHSWGKTEPKWDAYQPERPRLVRRWVERCYGESATAASLAPRVIWPQDVLEDLLAGQRSNPRSKGRPPTPDTDAPLGMVVDAAQRFRAKQRA